MSNYIDLQTWFDLGCPETPLSKAESPKPATPTDVDAAGEDELHKDEQLEPVSQPKPVNPKKTPKKKSATPEDLNLVGIHNLSAENLHHAAELGGLVAPSVAITHKDHPLESFGDISLVANHDLIDPAKNPVFDADIYSPRHPRPKYNIDNKAVEQYRKWLKPHAEQTGTYLGDLEGELNKEGEHAALSSYSHKRALGNAFLKEKGVNIPVPMQDKAPWMAMPAMQEFKQKRGIQHYPSGDYEEEFGKAANKAVDQYLATHPEAYDGLDVNDADDRDAIRNHLLGRFNGKNTFAQPHFSDYAKWLEHGSSVPDTYAYGEAIESELKNHPEFENWARNKVKPLVSGYYLPKHMDHPVNGPWEKKIAYTPDNILREMTRRVRQGEDFNYGLGTARAAGARKFRNLEDLQKYRGKILPKAEFDKHKEEMDSRLGQLQSELAPYHERGGGFGSMKDLAEAVGESYKRGKWLSKELAASGFKNVPPELQQKVAKFAKDLKNMPTEYFESKPQRVVGLNEFRGAAVPHTADEATIQALHNAGIHHIEHYNKETPGDRAKAIQRIANAHKLMLSEKSVGEPLTKMALIHDDATKPMVVYRVQNERGYGPYTNSPLGIGGYETEHRPGPEHDFSEDEYAQMPGLKFGFESPEHAQAWFGPDLDIAKQYGFHLVPVQASKVYRSKSGKQVAFVPFNERPMSKADESHPTAEEWLAGRKTYDYPEGPHKQSPVMRMLEHPDPDIRATALKYPELERVHPNTPEFNKWFAGSHVVDHEGKPRVVFHGSRADFSSFDPAKLGSATGAPSANQGFFFSGRSNTAGSYTNMVLPHEKEEHDKLFDEAKKARKKYFQYSSKLKDPKKIAAYEQSYKDANKKLEEAAAMREAGGNVMPVYLSFKNPYYHDMKGKGYRDQSYNDIIQQAKAKGHDSAIIRNTYDAVLGDALPDDVYVAFHPHQIKSAISNRGTYDPNNPDVTKAESHARVMLAETPMSKGAMGRLASFDPARDAPNGQAEKIFDWQENIGQKSRRTIPRLEGAGRVRALHKLHGVTQARINPATNKRQFLLHRGMGEGEHEFATENPNTPGHATQESITSWTPDFPTARRFSQEYGGPVVSAWIDEDAIHHVPMQFGNMNQHRSRPTGSNRWRNEFEVFVGPHSSPIETQAGLAKSESETPMSKGELPKIVHEQPVSVDYIHSRGTIPTANYGERFNQHLEPAGKYLQHHESVTNMPAQYGNPKDWGGATYFEYGTAHFQKPWVHQMAEGESPLEWKKVLSAANGNRTGKKLSAHLKKLGYDGIIALHHRGHISEMVNLGAPETIRQPMPVEAPKPRIKKSESDETPISKAEPITWTGEGHPAVYPAQYEPGGRVSKIQMGHIGQFHRTDSNPESEERIQSLMAQMQKDPSAIPPVLAEFGYTEDENNDQLDLLDGHHRLEAARRLGITEIPVRTFIPADVDYQPGMLKIRRAPQRHPNSWLKKAESDEISKLLQHEDPSERSMALKLHGVQPKHLIIALNDPEMASAALAHPAVTPEVLSAALQMLPTRLQALTHHAITAPQLIDAYQASRPFDDADDVVNAISQHPATDESVIRALYDNGGATPALLSNTNTPTDVLDHALRHGSNELANAAAAHGNTSPNALKEVLLGAPLAIQVIAAGNPSVPVDAAKDLLHHGHMKTDSHQTEVRRALIKNPALPLEVVEAALKDIVPELRTAARVRLGLEDGDIDDGFGPEVEVKLAPESVLAEWSKKAHE